MRRRRVSDGRGLQGRQSFRGLQFLDEPQDRGVETQCDEQEIDEMDQTGESDEQNERENEKDKGEMRRSNERRCRARGEYRFPQVADEHSSCCTD